MDGKLYTLRESKSFEAQAKKIADIRHIDAALNALTNAIARNPDAFPFVQGFGKIQLAKSDPYQREGVSVQPLRVWFRKISPDVVELLGIEPYEKDTD